MEYAWWSNYPEVEHMRRWAIREEDRERKAALNKRRKEAWKPAKQLPAAKVVKG